MSKLVKKLLNDESKKFETNLLKERNFGQYPNSLMALKLAAISSIELIISKDILPNIVSFIDFDITDNRLLKQFIKNNPRLSKILDLANNSLDNDITSELLTKCQNINDSIAQEFSNNFYSEISLDFIKSLNDIISKIENFLNKTDNFISSNMRYVEIGALTYYILTLCLDLIKNTDFPSIYRLKYIQKIIRYSLASIFNNIEEQFNNLKSILKKIDDSLIALSIASATYLYNRRKSLEAAKQLMLENACEKVSNDYIKNEQITEEVNSNKIDFNAIVCSTPTNGFAPKQPFINKLENFSCAIEYEEESSIIASSIRPELATKAKIENKRDNKFVFKVKKDSKVTTKTIIATVGNRSVYSPVNGHINILNDYEIVISDISDPQEDELELTINSLQSKYREINEIKSVLLEYKIPCLYPIMLRESPNIDGSITVTEASKIKNVGMEKQFQNIEKEWSGNKGILESYEKNIQNLTSEKNVKKHAENETLNALKEDIDKENNKVVKYLKQIDAEGVKIAKQTKAKTGEFELLEYYINNVALKINGDKLNDEAEDKLIYTPSLRDHINDFVRERYVVEEWKPKKIEDKAIELLKDLDKGVTNGSKLWKEGLDKYKEKKKLSDIKKWLENIKPKKSLSTKEINSLINRIFFLYEFYLNIDKFKKEYKDLKDQDTKEQTLREGNFLKKFFKDLQKRLDILPREIAELEKKLEDLSLLSKYFIQGEYRVYNINSEEFSCSSSYSKDAASKYGLGDINYWIKWCSFATLTGLLPVYWSTGFIGPTGPIPFPVIYLPLKPVETKWGVILIGLSITGLYIFPFILFANESSSYESSIPLPIIDKIKKEIEDIKNSVNEKLEKLKVEILEPKIENLKQDIINLNKKINDSKDQIIDFKLNRPPKNSSNYKKWKDDMSKIEEQKYELELQRWQSELKNNVLESLLEDKPIGKNSDESIKNIQEIKNNIQEKIDSIFDKIENLESKILAPLPTTLKPFSANFSITPKNPKPIIEIDNDLNQTVNNEVLGKLIEPFKLNNEDFMKGTVSFNDKAYRTLIKISKYLPVGGTVNKDPFPMYEDIRLINLPFQKFLTRSFLPKGAKTFGIPGQPPF